MPEQKKRSTEERIADLLSEMTLEEKASLCSGQDFWHLKGIARLGLPSIMVTDGPHGLRKVPDDKDALDIGRSVPSTCFPTASALAATWNRDLVFQVGQALGREARAEKVGVVLGPGLNIKRSPLGGRNFEYFSEDPYLTGEIATSHVSGVQSQGVGTSVKHFAANNQETRRMTIDTIVDERALREIYLAGFEIAVKEAQPWTIMSAYNRLNGTFCSEHVELLTTILKEEWGHEGLVITDWGAMDLRVEGLAAGTELEMPGVPNGNDDLIVAAVESGQLDEEVLDRAVERLLALILKAEAAQTGDHAYDPQAHHALARRAAAEGAVLLKNEGQSGSLLPLQTGNKVALVGRFAKEPRYQGAGSSLVNPTLLDNLYDEMVKLAGEENVAYAPGYAAKGDAVDEALIQDCGRSRAKSRRRRDMRRSARCLRSRGFGPQAHAAAGQPQRPDPGRRRRQSQRRRGAEQWRPGRDALGRRGTGHPGVLPGRPGRRGGHRRHPVWPGQSQRQAGRDLSPAPGGQSLPPLLPRRPQDGRIPGEHLCRLPLL